MTGRAVERHGVKISVMDRATTSGGATRRGGDGRPAAEGIPFNYHENKKRPPPTPPPCPSRPVRVVAGRGKKFDFNRSQTFRTQ